MDLDAARNAPVSPKCFCCKLPGHFGNNCPNHHDICMMSMEELEEVIQQWVIRLLDSEAEPEISKGFQPDSE